MAKVSFDNLPQDTEGGNFNNQVSFFNLKNGEEAIVRIMCDSTDDFDIHTVHNVQMQGYQYGRRMNCLREPQDPINACPLCAAGHKLQQKMFVRILRYTPDQQGNIVPQAQVWERSVNDRNFGARALKGYIDNYGPLSDLVCKIIRRGEGLNTEYQLIPALSPAVYRPEVYIKDGSLFGDWSPLGTAVLNKTFDEYTTFVMSGQFPQVVQNNGSSSTTSAEVTPRTYDSASTSAIPTQAPQYPTSAPEIQHQAPMNPQFNAAPTQPAAAPQPVNAPRAPWQNAGPQPATGGFERPRRY